ncbi:Conserved hypothetical protein CHP02466 [uncultured Caudovirales phage]|uniref:Fe2OG dioxygenase domain-containing protein n=1 Tax=uncultured Caudovirales phage TaxID=2100421 RepID=A0A6J5KXZ1_9CAUD|nr:Conserved hypothetical protein CHP02466 [uncultured Caudovirales phage]CAB5209232.1 Conserved hypothetical protein CHP02466 [uncultured Caudovirales phage]
MTERNKVIQLNNGGLFLFPPDIWKFKYDFNFSELKPKIDHLFSVVERNSDLEAGDALSTVALDECHHPHTWGELAHFQNWLGEKIAIIRKENAFNYTRSEVIRSWFNRHRYGGETIEHNHNQTTFVVSCYIQLPPDSGFIEFKDPLEYHKTLYPIIPEESSYRAVPCETNDVLIFPGYIRHRVQKNNNPNDERIVLTFNIR